VLPAPWAKEIRSSHTMTGILKDLQLLDNYRATKLATEAQIAELIRAAIEEISAIPLSLPGGISATWKLGLASHFGAVFVGQVPNVKTRETYERHGCLNFHFC